MKTPIQLRLSIALIGVCLLASLSICSANRPWQSNSSNTSLFRLVWLENPTSKATIGWSQPSNDSAILYYGTVDHGRETKKYKHSQKVDRQQNYDDLYQCFVRLENLQADRVYYFCIEDQQGVSPRFQFQTAPSNPERFTFIAGGDSRNFREPRVHANQLCARLKPLFVAFTGDMINRCNAASWKAWLSDWQHTVSEDGSLTPIVPHRGNHEIRPESLPNYFDTNKDSYYAFSIGGDLFRYYALNSEIPAGGDQLKWLEYDLAQSSKKVTHLIAGYHKPMRPHVSAKREGKNPYTWAPYFYHYGVDLVIESDSHVIKRTYPVRPDLAGEEGFVIAEKEDPNATVYIGEGCWGAPLRKANDAKSWTQDAASFNGFDWIEVSPKSIKIRTVKVKHPGRVEEHTKRSDYTVPNGLELWAAKGGEMLRLNAD